LEFQSKLESNQNLPILFLFAFEIEVCSAKGKAPWENWDDHAE
jgi:hypothetical protein